MRFDMWRSLVADVSPGEGRRPRGRCGPPSEAAVVPVVNVCVQVARYVALGVSTAISGEAAKLDCDSKAGD